MFAVVEAPAQATNDIGDGSVVCNVGEICFEEVAFCYPPPCTSFDRKQFWNGANHGANAAHPGYRWTVVPPPGRGDPYLSNDPVMDTAGTMRNRDTDCTVYVWDVDSYGNWTVYVSQPLLSSSYINIYGTGSWSGTHYQNGHSRCGGSPGYNPQNL